MAASFFLILELPGLSLSFSLFPPHAALMLLPKGLAVVIHHLKSAGQ